MGTDDELLSVQAAMAKLEVAHKQANEKNASLTSSKAAVDKAFALLKDTSAKTVAAMQTQRNLDAATIEQLTRSAGEAQANFEKVQSEQAAFTKRIAEQDEQLQQSYSNELSQENRMAKLESQLLALENEYETHMSGCGKLTSSLQQDKTSAGDRVAALEEMVKKGSSEIDSLTEQLAEVSKSKALVDTRISQLESQWKTDSDALTKQVCYMSLCRYSFTTLSSDAYECFSYSRCRLDELQSSRHNCSTLPTRKIMWTRKFWP